MSWERIKEILNAELPQVPIQPIVEQINPPGKNLGKHYFGQYTKIPENVLSTKKKTVAKKAVEKEEPGMPKA